LERECGDNKVELTMTARIYKPSQNAMQSGPSQQKWVLEYKPTAPRRVDPLMGWTSSTDMLSQVRLAFPGKKEAVDYARRHGIAALVEEPSEAVASVRPMGYAANFAFRRRTPWSH
jgi:NADH dehydrogenase